jgi:hypothetical protein
VPSSPSTAACNDYERYTLEGCGYTNAASSHGVDTSYEWVFDDAGKLIGVDFNNNGLDMCVGGPTDAALVYCSCPQGCVRYDAGCD